MPGVMMFLAYFLIMTTGGKEVGQLSYSRPVTYEECRDLIAHREMYLKEVQQADPHFTLDKGHCDPVDKPGV